MVLAPEIKVLPGRALMARVVVANGTGRGSLSIAGYLLEAELPKDVRTGDDLRLIVREVTPERVLLSLSEGHVQAPAGEPVPTQPPPMEISLPGGGTVQVTEREAHGGEGSDGQETQSLTLRYQTPALGAMDLRFELDPGSLRLAVTVAPATLEAAQADAGTLREGLSQELQRAVSVTVAPRREPVDVYA
jgi:hypothetical protein